MAGDEEKALDASCNDFIAKPITNRRLIQEKVERFLAQSTKSHPPR
jgi:CheY-like chemotaxis protein